MCNPVESEKKLLDKIREGRIRNVEEARSFENDEKLWFGPSSCILDVLTVNDSLGIIKFDKVTQKIEP